ncbi:MAG TPA: hypothetical protein VL860_15675 [Planctomycetota bacterium]|nr:hypothetical protein [Planctomycetota bacterium]
MKKSQGPSRRKSAIVAPAARRAKPAARPATVQRTVEATTLRKIPAAAVSARTAPARMNPEAVSPALRRALPGKGARAVTLPPAPPVVAGKKGKKGALAKGKGRAVDAANEVFMHSVIPTRIERLEILRQLYDKRKESPQKPDGAAARPAEEEEAEGEFVVSDEIVSSDSSEP